MAIQTIITDTYPIRYAANRNQGVWVESTHELAGAGGHETAAFRELTPNPAHSGDSSGIYVEIVRSAISPEFTAFCEADGPNRYRRSHNAVFSAREYEAVKEWATRWIETDARPWVANELANQLTFVEVNDHLGNTHPGHLWGVAADDTNCRVTWVQLDNPDAYPGRNVRDGRVLADWKNVHKVNRTVTPELVPDESGQYRLAI